MHVAHSATEKSPENICCQSSMTAYKSARTVVITQTRYFFMKHGILLHERHDDVGVAVLDLKKGSTIGAVTLEGKAAGKVRLLNNVPLGHKVAMRDLAKERP